MEPGALVNGTYRIVRLLGAGGMGSVFEAKVESGDLEGQVVALKVISSGDLAKNSTIIERFKREAKAASAIETRHIVKVVDAGKDEESGLPFMAMELLKGEDAQQLLDRLGPLPPKLALKVAAQACKGLREAHDARVVHRDIKPANLFLTKVGDEYVVKVLDFGVAKIKQEQGNTAETAGLTRTGSMLGSPLYMSPEQARGHKTIDHRADIWSLGVVLYQLLNGKTPHHEIDALGELIIAICSDPPKPLQERAAWVPPDIASVVHRALRFDPSERYQSAGSMLDAIDEILSDGDVITADQLVGLTVDEKQQVAVRIDTTELGPPPPPRHSELPPAGPPPSAGAVSAPGGTNEGVTQSQVEPKKSMGVVPIVALLVVAAVVAVVALQFAGGETNDPTPAPATIRIESSAPPEDSAEEPPEASASAPGIAPQLDLPPKTVKVVIVPSTASVEVGGEPVKSKDGIVELTGPLGSQHKLRVFIGAREVEEEIVIADGGAIPPKVELSIPGMPKSPPPGGQAPPPPPPPPPPSGATIDEEFH